MFLYSKNEVSFVITLDVNVLCFDGEILKS